MNIEIANRLVQLRKANNLSQEALAEKLGISRQAVSKWERAEASPDTDNLILLARLYQVSLDDLLKTDEEIILERDREEEDTVTQKAADATTDGEAEDATGENDGTEAPQTSDTADDKAEYVHIGLSGIHVKDKDGEVHVGWDGIHVVDTDDEVHIDKGGVYVNGEEVKGHIFGHHQEEFPLGFLAVVAYIAIGCMYNLWHPGWLLFFFIPIISSAIKAIRKRRAEYFAYPVLVVLVFLYAGFVKMLWHPAWVLFLTIPVYYELIHYFNRKKK